MSHRPQGTLGRHRPQQPLQRHLNVLAPGQRCFQLEPKPWEAQVRPDRLESDCEKVLGWKHTGWLLPLQVAKRFNGLDATPGEVLCHALDQDTAEPTSGELVEHIRCHQ